MRKFGAVSITCAFSWLCTYLGIYFFADYAWGMFIWLPFVMGATSTVIYCVGTQAKFTPARNISFLALLVYSVGLLLFAWEGAICLLMAMPLGLFFNWLGHRTGFWFVKNQPKTAALPIIIGIFSVPMFMAFEDIKEPAEKVRSVVTSIEIAAPPEVVWKNVVSFPKLSEPTELIFKMGIAFPIEATITGEGVGAVRHCNFSTGAFVEPITTWEEGKLLRFSVEAQPAPMKELSFYDIQPTHLNGYWISKQGQFKLTRLPDGNTLLEGTTWYVNKIKPDFYWTLWSDYIVLKIHKRVLNHIKTQAEKVS